MLFLRHYYDQNKLKRVDIYHHIEYASASKKKVDHFFEVLAKLYQFTISAFLTIYDSWGWEKKLNIVFTYML